MMRQSILALAAICLSLTLGAQNKYNISDDEKTLSKKELAGITQMLDYELSFYNRAFGEGSISRDAVKMTVLKDYPSFVFYLDKAGMQAPRNIAGIYSSKLNEVVMWRGEKTDERFLETAYHEMSHAMIRAKMQSPPVWLNEGLATWFGYMKVGSKSIRPEPYRYYLDRVKTLIEIGDLDLKDFLTWDNAKFGKVSFSQDGYGYAVAYCMISLLFKNNEAALYGIIREVTGGKSSLAAFDACYPGGFSTFEKEFLAAYK